MPYDFFCSSGVIASSQTNRRKAKENALAEIRNNGCEDTQLLKKYFDQYYNNTFYLTSNFCKMWKKCQKNVKTLIHQLNENLQTGFLSEIKQSIKEFENIKEKIEKKQKEITQWEQNAKISKMITNPTPALLELTTEENPTEQLDKDYNRTLITEYEEFCKSVINEYKNSSNLGEGKFLEYTQGDAATIARLYEQVYINVKKKGWYERVWKQFYYYRKAYKKGMYEQAVSVLPEDVTDIAKKLVKLDGLKISDTLNNIKNMLKIEENSKQYHFEKVTISRTHFMGLIPQWMEYSPFTVIGTKYFMKIKSEKDVVTLWKKIAGKIIDIAK